MAVWMGWLLDAARMTGYPVIEVGGWRSRGHGPMRVVEGVVAHHTADGPTGSYPSLNIVTHGRAGLAGPLSQLGLGRDGTIYVIAAGKAWHAGSSSWAGMWDLNDEFIGIEAESVGTRDDWSAAQRDAYPRLCAALLHYMRRPATRLAAHREIALPTGRKIDPAFWDMNGMRTRVAWLLDDPQHRIPRFANPAPAPAPTATGGTVIPVQLPATPAPAAGVDSADWPWREEVVSLGYVGGWRGRCNLRISFGHPGGRLLRAHVDVAEGTRPVVHAWPGLPEWPGMFVEPAHRQAAQVAFLAPSGPAALMITYAAPGGASLNLEWEK